MFEGWTRRQFMQVSGMVLLAQQGRMAVALRPEKLPTYAYVAADDCLHVLQSRQGAWQLVQTVESPAPSAVTLSAKSDLLFVANALTHVEGLPTGSVESYRVDVHTHTIRLVGRATLGLAAVMPHALALSPDGSLLVVAASRGVYNLLPVEQDGALGEVTAARKELVLAANIASTKMRFVDREQLQVQDARGSRLYRCDRDGLQLLGSTCYTPDEDEPDLLLPGQRSIAFA